MSRPETARLPHVVRECLLTLSMLIKMYIHDIYSHVFTVLNTQKYYFDQITDFSHFVSSGDHRLQSHRVF